MNFQFGWSAIFGLNFFLIVANLIYIGCVVVDKKKPVRDGTSGDYLANITVISFAQKSADFKKSVRLLESDDLTTRLLPQPCLQVAIIQSGQSPD